MPHQLIGHLLGADALLRQRHVQLRTPVMASVQRVGVLEAQKLIQRGADLREQSMQVGGLGGLGAISGMGLHVGSWVAAKVDSLTASAG